MATVIVEEITGKSTIIEQTVGPTVIIGPTTTISSFTALTDTPSIYAGQAGKVPSVKASEDGLEFISFQDATEGVKPKYTEFEWLDGLPVLIEKYANNTKVLLMETITPTFIDGLPSEILKEDHVNNTSEITYFTFSNGLPVSINTI